MTADPPEMVLPPTRPSGKDPLEWLVVLATAVFVGLIYVRSICPTVFWWDSGELIANIKILGIAHRPGFPLYLLLGKVFSFLPFFSFAARINLFSALCATAAAVFLFLTLRRLFGWLCRPAHLAPAFFHLVTCGAVIACVFTYSFWIQATRAEVYSLNILFFSILFFLAVRLALMPPAGAPPSTPTLALFGYLTALGLGNHHAILISTLPAFGFLFFRLYGRALLAPRRLFLWAALAAVGISIYLYLPIRSAQEPLLHWGSQSSAGSTVAGVIAADSFSEFSWRTLTSLPQKFGQIGVLFWDQFTPLLLVVVLGGWVALWGKSRTWWFFSSLLLLGNALMAAVLSDEIILDNPDLHGYLQPSILTLGLWFGVGIFAALALVDRTAARWHARPDFRWLLSAVFSGFFFLIGFLPWWSNRSYADLSANRLAERVGLSVLEPLPEHAVAFIDNPNLDFILRGLQIAENKRPDVIVVDRALLGGSWYVRQTRRNFPFLFAGVPEHLAGESLFVILRDGCLEQGIPAFMEFTEHDISFVHHLMPSGYLYQIRRDSVGEIPKEVMLYQKEWARKQFINDDDVSRLHDVDGIRMLVLTWFRTGLFFEAKGLRPQAQAFYRKTRRAARPEKALPDHPQNPADNADKIPKP